ncbi:GNAT family N-acetyltransferase [Sphaerisporangium corydalis]|uniref:GNAT family N-acetyltransferase n=1 Tax=Sphaerisporangium corydalis TaxID=1441875 RepID=A0ABV9EN92_9ACTN|nr:GNAT family N-acetyltransferase [Sphaerisporangium corydalis]
MTWTFTEDIGAYADAVEAWLRRDPALNTVPLTVLDHSLRGPVADGAFFAWWTEDGEVGGAASRVPPYPLLLAKSPPHAIERLARDLAAQGRPLASVVGPGTLAQTFAAAWGQPEIGRVDERLYRLSAYARPDPQPSGEPRVAGAADLDLVVEWYRRFRRDAGVDDGRDPTPLVEDRLGHAELMIWQVRDRPVALAGASSPIEKMSRVAPVYTPEVHRGHGYGAAVALAVSRKALADGAEQVLLFADLAGPRSNMVYQAIGYRPVADFSRIRFGARHAVP